MQRDSPLNSRQLAELRDRLAKMSVTALYDFYEAAYMRCKLNRQGGLPRAEFVQELVAAWKEMRKAGS